MLVTKEDVTGIDIPIQKLQTYLFEQLKTIWQYGDAEFDAFGRAYRNQTQDGYTPEVYNSNKEYSDAYFDDTKWGSSFFGLGETTKVTGGDVTANVFLIYMVNLSQIKNQDPRNDEEARVDVERLVLTPQYGFNLTGIITGIDQVFKEYSGYKAVKGIKFRDMQPWHCFRLNFQVVYNIYDCN